MGTFKLQINTDNAAFDDLPWEEVSRILTKAARDISHARYEQDGWLFDSNGNKVGDYTWAAE